MTDTEFVTALVTEVRSAMDTQRKTHTDELAVLRAQIDGLLKQVAAIPPVPTVDYDAIAKDVVSRIPVPKDGENGKDAVVDYAQVTKDVLALIPPPTVDHGAIVEDVVSRIPAPKDGENGKDAVVDYARVAEDVLASIPVPKVDHAAIVEEVVSRIPTPRDGQDGKDAVVDYLRVASEIKALIPTPKDGRDGKDGRDSDITKAEIAAFVAGEIEKSITGIMTTMHFEGKTLMIAGKAVGKLAFFEHRGVWVKGLEYEPGDAVAWGGSTYVCVEPTTDKPDDNAKAWKLAAKKGRDGKDAK